MSLADKGDIAGPSLLSLAIDMRSWLQSLPLLISCALPVTMMPDVHLPGLQRIVMMTSALGAWPLWLGLAATGWGRRPSSDVEVIMVDGMTWNDLDGVRYETNVGLYEAGAKFV